MTRLLVATIAMMFVFAILIVSALAEQGQWKEELERLCSFTEVSSTLADDELLQLVKGSDVLLEKLESLEASKVKVYIFRLKKCRNMYVYTMDIRAAREKRD